jgi:hypothetical protein
MRHLPPFLDASSVTLFDSKETSHSGIYVIASLILRGMDRDSGGMRSYIHRYEPRPS